MNALILAAVVVVLVAVAAPLARWRLLREGVGHVTATLTLDVEPFRLAMLGIGRAAREAGESMRKFGDAWAAGEVGQHD